jgi:hypothetical protein
MMGRSLRFVFDGSERQECASAILFEQIRAEVLAEFGEQLANGTFWQRIKLRRLIRREIARRLPKAPSPYSLYGYSLRVSVW